MIGRISKAALCLVAASIGALSCSRGQGGVIGGEVKFLPFDGMKGTPAKTVLTTSDVGIEFTFNSDGTVLITKDSLTGPYKITTTYSKDGRKESVSSPDGSYKAVYSPEGAVSPVMDGMPLRYKESVRDTIKWIYPDSFSEQAESVYEGLTCTTSFHDADDITWETTFDGSGRILSRKEDCLRYDYTYSDEGLLIEEERGSDCVGEKEVRSYSYTSFDAEGNWTERSVVIKTSVSGTENRWTTIERNTVEKREITY